MRFRLPVRRTVFFLAALTIALLVLLPLRFAAGWFDMGGRGLAYQYRYTGLPPVLPCRSAHFQVLKPIKRSPARSVAACITSASVVAG